MKRFYTDVALIAVDGGWQVQLDKRPVRTPARAPLVLPSARLGEAVAAEWRGQGDMIDPRSMPMTGLANAAIDQITPNHVSFAAAIAQYGESDLLCYRAEAPGALVARQAAAWDPLLDWAQARYDVTLRTTQGIIHVPQLPETLARLSAVVATLDPFTLAGLSSIVSLTGSLVCGLALFEEGQSPEMIWQAAELDETWQAEQWGEDAQAMARRAARRADFDMACTFCGTTRG